MKYRYSPHPIKAYFIPGVERCEIREIAKQTYAVELWNLFWLSVPSVDSLVGASPRGYWRNYISSPELVGAIFSDCLDEKMMQMLAKPPASFHSWWCNEIDYTIYDTWEKSGPGWVETVADRSDEAALRRLGNRPMIFTEGRVLRIDLSKAA